MTEYFLLLLQAGVMLAFLAPACIAGAFVITEALEPYETDSED